MAHITIKPITLVILCQLAAFTYAAAQKPATVSVRVHNKSGQSVSLYKVENGKANRIGFRWPAANDTCVFSLLIQDQAVYYLAKTSAKASDFSYVIYLKPGEHKWIDAYSSQTGFDFDSCKVVHPNTETVLLQQWTNRLNNYCKLGANPTKRKEFITGYDEFVKEAEQLKKKAVTPNRYFNRLLVSKINAEIIYPKAAAFFNFVSRMNSQHDSSEAHKPFYHSLDGKKFCNTDLLYSEHGMQLLNYCLSYNLIKQKGDKEKALATPVSEKAKSLCNDTVRGAFLSQHMAGITNYEQFTKDIEPFKKSFVLPGMKNAYEQKVDELTLYAKGLPAYNFSLYDTKGNLHSLSDFKGKVVVVDIWAMWCAPCLAEKPFFIKVEEEFKDREDIIFMGISVDGLPARKVWEGFVQRKGWKNIELLSNHDESIMKYYKIAGIPRFMIFDKEGRIITVDGPRPSRPEFKKLIEETLKSSDHATSRK